MGDGSKIEWTDATWQIITGCSVVSPGCTNCYAMRLAGTRLRHHPSRAGLTDDSKAGPVWNGSVHFNHDWLDQPLRWRKPRMIFVCAHGALRPAIEAYVNGKDMTPEQIAAMRAYLRQWIEADGWAPGKRLDILRQSVDMLVTRDAIAAWLASALHEGIDPL